MPEELQLTKTTDRKRDHKYIKAHTFTLSLYFFLLLDIIWRLDHYF